MDEIKDWFLEKYGGFGFTVGGTLIDTVTLAPYKPIYHPSGRVIRIKIKAQGYGRRRKPIEVVKTLISNEMMYLYGDMYNDPLRPVKRLEIFKLKRWDDE